eukprot:TRINITY_DN10750_c2_g1_i1.p1 TRINITY_DN10750_c2_g1~~TRINITY_DN10750_c2_g1_i1.p1  ORF type:complete len:233 (+),score=56.80 TRINITY_DN10750_c2_g1_i1:31-699(+)
MSSLDLDAIRKRLEGAKMDDAPKAEAPKDGDCSPLGGQWLEGTRFGEQGSETEKIGKWLKDNWDQANSVPPDEGGLLGNSKECEAEGGPPNRLQQLKDLETIAGQGELDYPTASAFHCAFGLLFWLHQQAISFQPNLSISAAGQKSSGTQESLFNVMVKVANLLQQICRDVRNLTYVRYGREKRGLKNVGAWSRGAAEEIRKHGASLKEAINAKMADSIGMP